MGAAVKDLTTGEMILINGDEVFPVASTIKVPILIATYAAVAEGKANLWGTPLAFIEPESEHSSASTCEGWLGAGPFARGLRRCITFIWFSLLRRSCP